MPATSKRGTSAGRMSTPLTGHAMQIAHRA